MTTILVDADVLVYSSAFAAQKTRYHLTNPLGGLKSFENADECKTFCKENGIDYALARKTEPNDQLPWITSQVEVFPEALSLEIAAQALDRLVLACGGSRTELYLTGEGNYRNQYAKTKGYKANREQPKPVHFDLVRAFYSSRRDCTVVSGMEADDAMGIRQTDSKNECIIATIDKDLNCLPGRHYNWDKKSRYTVPEFDAIRWFCAQVLMGDTTDNVPGIPGIGEEKAFAAVNQHKRLDLMWGEVIATYEDAGKPTNVGKKNEKPPKIAKPMEYLAEQGILLWIQRKPDERWNPDAFYKEHIHGR